MRVLCSDRMYEEEGARTSEQKEDKWNEGTTAKQVDGKT